MYLPKYCSALVAAVILPGLTAMGTEVTVDAAKPLNVSKAGDDVAQLKRLALNVGTEFGPNRVTDAYLKRLGIRTIRLINVGISGRFDDQGNYVDIKGSPRLEQDLALCTRLNANPHIIIHGMAEQLLKSVPLKETRHRALGIDLVNKRQHIGPTDYKLLENWYLAYFEYIKIQLGFKDAAFEIFNEPDLGSLLYPTDEIPPKGSDASYECMLKIYRAASAAAKRFEAKHPDRKLMLGGPAVTLGFTYRFADQWWAKRFVGDCASEKLKLDFMGLHHYASVSPFRGASRTELTAYPSFPEMIAELQAVIDLDMPGLPVWITEYGPHHNVVEAIGNINGNHDGAAFSLDCLTVMLEQGVDFAIYLVTADQQRRDPNTKESYNLYSWCSFLTSPGFHGYPYPKAPFHAYKMVSELTGKRVAATASGGNTRTFAAADPATETLRVLLWNFETYIPEWMPVIEEGKSETVRLIIANTTFPDDAKAVLRMVDKEHGDVLSADQANRTVNLAAATPKMATLPIRRDGKNIEFELVMQPGSVAMIEIGTNPQVPSLKTEYSEQAGVLLKVMRDNRDEQPEKTFEAGKKLLKLANLHPEQKIDALALIVAAAVKARKPDVANTFALNAETFCREMNKPLPYAAARQLGDSERMKKQFAAAAEHFRQAVAAPDCDWRLRFGTELELIECLNAERKFAEVIEFCDAVIARKDDDGRPSVLKGDYRLRKLEALRDLGQTEAMLAVYDELLESNADDSAKLGGVIPMVVFYRQQKELDKALAEGQIGLALEDPHPGLLGKLEGILKEIGIEKAEQK